MAFSPFPIEIIVFDERYKFLAPIRQPERSASDRRSDLHYNQYDHYEHTHVITSVLCPRGGLRDRRFAVDVPPEKLRPFAPLPSIATSQANPLTEDKIALGRMLYFDPAPVAQPERVL